MSLGSLYVSLRGRLSPKSFADGFWRLAFIDSTLSSFTPTRNSIGYPFNHWAILAYEVTAAWPLFALTAKRLHDSGRSLTLAMLAAVALPFADAASLASDYGALDIVLAAISSLPSLLILFMWTGLMWYIYHLPSSSDANRFGLPASDRSDA
jgi:uncharacterized membrane protein YhaH (DUF805 family)